MEHDRHDPEHALLVVLRHSHDRHGFLRPPVPLLVVHVLDLKARALGEILVFLGRLELEGLALLVVRPVAQLVERMERPLRVVHENDPGPLEQVGSDGGAADPELGVELDLHVLSEPGRVVVPHRLGVSKGLQDRVGLQDLLLHRLLPALLLLRVTPHEGQVVHDQLARLRLSRPTLPADENGLALVVQGHLLEGLLGYRVHVR
mmetsp:Transcript_5900/g.17761  ORF Transcript_5900/g.17761 Transcript_5900/m.17761 type:complete len:204 (-) Transcript_5900:553-1164(-)